MKKLFKDNHPQLFKELHPSNNKDIDFSKLFENSGLKLSWQCKINPRHVWDETVGRRAIQGYGCPYCSGRRTLPEESFSALYPDIAAEIHPTKNQNFVPYKYSPNSNKKIWWLCINGHPWKSSIKDRVNRNFNCKLCKKINNSLAKKYPELAKEWHPTKNEPLKPTQVLVSSNKKIWWRCLKDPSHEWDTLIRSRVYGKSGCSKCSRKAAQRQKLPPLSEYSLELAKQWHPTKNGNLKPSDVSAGSPKKVWWICPDDVSHEWPAIVSNRARKGQGCPKCSNRGIKNPENSLAVRFPYIAKQWHPTKNGKLSPSNLSYGSSKKVWWQCQFDKSHEWPETINSRTNRNKEKCPFCYKSTYSPTNSLQAVHPDIAKEWHPTKNDGLSPSQVTRASGRKVWWQCTENKEHEWEAVIRNRTVLKSGCPDCSNEKNIIRLSEHLFDLVHSDIDYFHVFLANLRTLRKFTEINFPDNSRMTQPFYRMVYSSVITTLETFLSDAFYKNVINNDELIEKFIQKNPDFNKRQYSLAEVIDWNNNIKRKTTDYLFSIIWHNLPKVQNMYKNVLNVEFLEDISSLLQAVAIRHDLVHRNGRTKDGKLHKINKDHILNLISEAQELAVTINNQLTKTKSEQKDGV